MKPFAKSYKLRDGECPACGERLALEADRDSWRARAEAAERDRDAVGRGQSSLVDAHIAFNDALDKLVKYHEFDRYIPRTRLIELLNRARSGVPFDGERPRVTALLQKAEKDALELRARAEQAERERDEARRLCDAMAEQDSETPTTSGSE